MVKEGYWFGVPPVGASFAALLLHSYWLAAPLLVLGAFVFYFFRDPEREIPRVAGGVVAPADGRVVVVTDESYEGRAGKRISIFLAVWNVHVNRAPAAGTITQLEYKPGKFHAAMLARASVENEQNVFHLATEAGEIVFKQIAGWVARRVVSWKRPGDKVACGERIGMIRFGSRMDVWLPQDAEIRVRPGERVAAGSSILAHWERLAQAARDLDATRAQVGIAELARR
jgi:phosphatidylserine decarboxylase